MVSLLVMASLFLFVDSLISRPSMLRAVRQASQQGTTQVRHLHLQKTLNMTPLTTTPTTATSKSTTEMIPATTVKVYDPLHPTTTTSKITTEMIPTTTLNDPLHLHSPSSLSDPNGSRALVLLAASLYGTNFASIKILDQHMPTAAGLSLRFLLAAAALSPFLFTGKGDGKGVLFAGLEIGLLNSVGYVFQAIGLQETEADKSAFICSLAVVVVPLLDFVFRGKMLSQKSLISCILAVCGVAMLEGSSITHGFTNSDLFTLVQPGK
mgnify:CR=1 FL=1